MSTATPKRWILVVGAAVVLILAFGVTWAIGPWGGSQDAARPGPRKVLAIKGMTCERCEGHVRAELEEVDDVVVLSVSASDGTATIRVPEGGVSEEACREAVFKAGYILEEMRDVPSP